MLRKNLRVKTVLRKRVKVKRINLRKNLRVKRIKLRKRAKVKKVKVNKEEVFEKPVKYNAALKKEKLFGNRKDNFHITHYYP